MFPLRATIRVPICLKSFPVSQKTTYKSFIAMSMILQGHNNFISDLLINGRLTQQDQPVIQPVAICLLVQGVHRPLQKF